MVWSRVRPVAACVLLVSLLSVVFPIGSAEADPQVYFYDGFGDLEGWTFEGDAAVEWGLTTDRAHNGSALYLGDDQGTPDPEDNRFDCFRCQGVAVSPAFALPADRSAFLYFWSFVEIDLWDDAGFRVAVRDDGVESPLGDVPQLKGNLIRFDLSAHVGETIQLVFDLQQGWPWREEGLYLDDVLVTDLEVTVGTTLSATDDGPALEAFFTIPPEGTSGIIELEQEGFGGRSIGGQMFLFRGDRTVFAIGFWGSSVGPSLDVDLLGEEIIRHNSTGGGWEARAWAAIDLAGLGPGDYRLVTVLHGTHASRSDVMFYANGALDSVRVAAGGEDLAYVFLSDVDSAALHTAVAGVTLVMVDGAIERTTTGRSLAMVRVSGLIADITTTTPEGTAEMVWSHFAEQPGTWKVDVHHVVAGDRFPALQVVQFPVLPGPTDLPASDPSALPGIGDGAELPEPEPEPEPDPEPEPWPTGYNQTASASGLISCGVATGPLQTADLCAPLDGNSQARFSFPLPNGTTSIDLEVSTGPSLLTDARVCAMVLRPIEVERVVCSDEGRLTVWRAEEGSAITRGDGTIQIDVRIAPDEGVLHQQQVHLDVETAHWGGRF